MGSMVTRTVRDEVSDAPASRSKVRVFTHRGIPSPGGWLEHQVGTKDHALFLTTLWHTGEHQTAGANV